MTKAIVVLKALIAKRRLREICLKLNISYKYCYAISKEQKDPSYDLMNKFLFLIPCEYWFEKATKEFVDQIRENIENE